MPSALLALGVPRSSFEWSIGVPATPRHVTAGHTFGVHAVPPRDCGPAHCRQTYPVDMTPIARPSHPHGFAAALAAVALATAAATTASAAATTASASPASGIVGSAAPRVRVDAPDGKTIDTAMLRGHPLF